MKNNNWILLPLNKDTFPINPLSKWEKQSLSIERQILQSKLNGRRMANGLNWITGYKHYNDK